jgi:hypothetical protein
MARRELTLDGQRMLAVRFGSHRHQGFLSELRHDRTPAPDVHLQ